MSLTRPRPSTAVFTLAVVMVALLACSSSEETPTLTPLQLPPTPTAIIFPPTPTAISLPPTPTAISLPPTPTAISLPPTPTPISFPPTPTPITIPGPVQTGRSTADIVEEVTPSVVAIQVQTRFGESSGTGVILESDGLILTNQHVIDSARTITVALTDDRVFEATVIGEDRSADIAVIKIEAEGLQTAVLGDSEGLRVGEDVIAIGHALGLAGGPTVSKGVVSALGRTVTQGGEQLTDLIQTDAAINPGNSGGPLLNTDGRVIGINTARLNTGEGIGFAIEINTASSIVQQLIEESTLPPGDLGIAESIDITPALALILGLRVSRGVGIIALEPGGAVAIGGMLVDDIIVEMNGDDVVDRTDVSRFLRHHRAGESVEITFLRGNLFFRAQVVLKEVLDEEPQ